MSEGCNDDTGNGSQSKPSSSNLQAQQPVSGDEKLKQVVRQLYQEKQELKKLLEKEINDHETDVKRLNEEKKAIQDDYMRLAETFANSTQLSSPEQETKIQQLQNEQQELTSQLKMIKIELNESKLNQQVLQKQVEQYKLTVSSLEEELTKADGDKYQLAVAKTQVSKLEDDVRQKNREIKELETSAKWNHHEIQKLKGQLAQVGARSQIFVIENGETISLAPKTSLIPALTNQLYIDIQNKSPQNESEIADFIVNLSSRFQSINDERDNLMKQLAQYKHKYSLVTSKKTSKCTLPPEKLEETIRFLMTKNENKKQSIIKLKDLVERQHNAIKKLQEEINILAKTK